MSKYTPGPWAVKMREQQYSITTLNDHGHDVPIATIVADMRELIDPSANARLISSTPDMYEFIKACRQIFITQEFDSWVKRADEIIAKVEGRDE